MNVVIIGAGMGGLTTGIALKKFGHQVTIFEQAEQILPVGAAISLWSNGVKCLNYLGLNEQIAKLGGQMDNLAYVDGLTGDVMTEFSLQPLIEEVGQRQHLVTVQDQVVSSRTCPHEKGQYNMNQTVINEELHATGLRPLRPAPVRSGRLRLTVHRRFKQFRTCS